MLSFMKRNIKKAKIRALGVFLLLITLFVSLNVSAQTEDSDLELLHVQGNVYLVAGGGGNTALLVGEQGKRVAARAQLAGQRFGREHMAARAARHQHDRVHVALRRNGEEVLNVAHHTSPKPARLRVSASTMPMPKAMPSREEPP